mgnify:CR=1 FL=1
MLNNWKRLAVVVAAVLIPAVAAQAKDASAIMYKNPGCECCDGHAAALRRAGLAVKVVPTGTIAAVKEKAGVPAALQGCHTVLIAGYAVEGHVPVSAVKRLLAEKPSVAGIALPGMPSGSPGMAGPKTGPFEVMSFGPAGTKLFAVE